MPDKFDIEYKLLFGKTPDEIVEYLKSKNIKITWNWQEQLKLIQDEVFTIAKVLDADLLQDIQESLIKNLAEGGSFDQFKKDIEPILEQKGYLTRSDGSSWKLDLIYRQNLQNSFMKARYLEQVALKDTFPIMQYIAIDDSRTTTVCRSLNGKIFYVNDKYTDVIYPPNHFRCRSRITSLTEGQAARKGFVPEKLTTKDTKEVAKGFDKPPTTPFKPDTKKYFPELRKKVSKFLK